jgi:FtsP/CotA-like multicopper oxidase with cupredoxin domain
LFVKGVPAYGFWGFNFMNLHFHGMDFSPKTENLRTHVDGGESRTMTFKVPDDKEPGLYWYHNHVHGTTTYSYLASLYGMIVVEGTEHDVTNAVGMEGSREILMMLSDGLVNPDGSVPPRFPIFANFNWTGVTNGNLGEHTIYNVTQGETVLFRTASATTEATVRLSIPNVTFAVLAYDGLALSEPEETNVITIPGGGRVEFAARFDEVGTYEIKRAPWAPGFPNAEACAAFGLPFYPCWSFDKEQIIATVVVTASPDSEYVASTEALVGLIQLPNTTRRLQALGATAATDSTYIMKVDQEFPIFQVSSYNGSEPGVGFGINNRLVTPSYVEGYIAAGTCETCDVISDPPGLEHSFHVHQANFLVLAVDGIVQEKPVWHDTLLIQENATLHVCFDRAEAGDVLMAHCHMPNHFDIGMGAMYNVTARSDGEPIPSAAPVGNATFPPFTLFPPSAAPSGEPTISMTSTMPTAAPFGNVTDSPISVSPTATPTSSMSPLPCPPFQSLQPSPAPQEAGNEPASEAAIHDLLRELPMLASLLCFSVVLLW